ncbi:MAG: NfeD family protein [Cocleimonas sp.]|nr:NfeD family protein [Cocleimonas sp.]
MLSGIYENLVYWHWWVLAIVLIILEIFSPAAFFMWMSAAAAVVGLILLGMPELTWQTQFMLFALLSVATIIAGKYWFNRNPIKTDKPTLNTREDDLIGKVFEVEKAIINGNGRIKVGESTWKAHGPDCKAGDSVRVVSVSGAELTVELV